jgi:hypothetical protein
LFLGTAHRGTPLASLGVKIGWAATALGTDADTTLIEKLREDSKDMHDVVNDFAIQVREYSIGIVCFYERYKTRISLNRRKFPNFFRSMETMVRARAKIQL